jgi:hypothetical protein
VLTPLIAGFLPFILLPVEYFLPYPYIVEEIAKGWLAYMVSRDEGTWGKAWIIVASAIMFTLTESIFYLYNILMLGENSLFIKRIIFTTPLHTFTMLLMYYGAKYGKVSFTISLVLASIIHFIYNSTVPLK